MGSIIVDTASAVCEVGLSHAFCGLNLLLTVTELYCLYVQPIWPQNQTLARACHAFSSRSCFASMLYAVIQNTTAIKPSMKLEPTSGAAFLFQIHSAFEHIEPDSVSAASALLL